MGAERCIVLLVVVVMGTGLFMVNSVVDEDMIKKYSEDVAEYNELHDETLLDNVRHIKRPSEHDVAEPGKKGYGHDQDKVKRSSGQGINEDPEHENEEQNDNRVVRSVAMENTDVQHSKTKRLSGQGIDEVPDHVRTARSSGQGINEDPEHENEEQNGNRVVRSVAMENTDVQHSKTKRSSGQGIDEVPDHVRTARSSGQGINEDPEHENEEQNGNRVVRSVAMENTDVQHSKTKRSSGQGIDEVPDHVRMARSSGQGISEDPEHENEKQNYYRVVRSVAVEHIDVQHTKTKRSSGQGIDEIPDHSRTARSSGQGINEDPEHENEEQNGYRAVRSVAMENTDVQHSKTKRSSGQGIDEVPDHIRMARSSGQGISEDPEHENGDESSFSETASNLDVSSEDEDGVEKEGDGLGNVETLGEIDPDSDEQEGKIDDALIESMLADSEQNSMTLTDESIPCIEEIKPQNGNDGEEMSHSDDIQNPYTYHYERENIDFDDSDNQPQIGYLLYNSMYAENDDDKVIKLNKGVDFVLGLMNSMFTGEGQLTVDLPDINKKFGHGIMAGNFNGTQGFFKNPATLHRTGDVAITKIGDTVSLEVALGLGTLEAGFEHYDLKILKIHQAGTIGVSVAHNSIKMKISLTYAPACNLTVDYVGLDQLDGIKLDITGLGAFQSMFDMLSKWFLDNFTVSFKDIVNQKLAEKARKAVAREDVCKYFPQ